MEYDFNPQSVKRFMERGAVMIVNEWPKTIATADGIICNPTPEQCRQAGYELAVPPTAEEIALMEAQKAQEEAERVRQNEIAQAQWLAEVEGLRQDYRILCNQFCQVAGVPVVDKLEKSAVKTEIEKANAGGNSQQILSLMQLAMALDSAITDLRRKDGDDAWERI